MQSAATAPGPLVVTALLAQRELLARLNSAWFWIIASVICVIAWIYGAGFQQTFATESVLVTTDPLMTLNILIVVFLSVVLALRLAASFAGEREHRTLEVLLVGPASWGAIVAAKFLVELCIMALLVLVYLAYLLLAQPLGAGVIAPRDTLGLLAMPAFALPILALGLLVAAWARTVRAAVVTFMAVLGALVAFEVGLGLLEARAPDQIALTELQVRSALETAAPVVAWVSAPSQLAALAKALAQNAAPSGTAALWSLGLTVGTLCVATALARLRGPA
jgi:ABC-type transport system involved in multi-copper enzyme maturation permease subunit